MIPEIMLMFALYATCRLINDAMSMPGKDKTQLSWVFCILSCAGIWIIVAIRLTEQSGAADTIDPLMHRAREILSQ